jgi:hypothetical protein
VVENPSVSFNAIEFSEGGKVRLLFFPLLPGPKTGCLQSLEKKIGQMRKNSAFFQKYVLQL